MIDHPDGFTVWYESGDVTVGVLTYNADDDYDLGERLIASAGRARCARDDSRHWPTQHPDAENRLSAV